MTKFSKKIIGDQSTAVLPMRWRCRAGSRVSTEGKFRISCGE